MGLKQQGKYLNPAINHVIASEAWRSRRFHEIAAHPLRVLLRNCVFVSPPSTGVDKGEGE